MPLQDVEQIILAYTVLPVLVIFFLIGFYFYGFANFIISVGHDGKPSSLLYEGKAQKGSQSLSEN